jgi:nitrate reductase NapE
MYDPSSAEPSRKDELKAFLLLTAVAAPLSVFLAVSGYGFLVWMYQLISGPPTGG